MKARIFTSFCLFFALIFATSCATTKKTVVETFHQATTDSIVSVETIKRETTTIIDTASIERGKVTVTYIEFFAQDTVVGATDNSATLCDVGTFANVKSIHQTTIDISKEEQRKAQEIIAIEEQREEVQVATTETEKTKEKKTSRFSLFYVLIIIFLIVVAMIVRRHIRS